jgi:hypothetical protein
MRRGLLLEPVAVQLLREERPDWVIQYPLHRTYYRDSANRLGCTPDAFATVPGKGGQVLVQIKTVSDWAWRKGWTDPDTREVVLPLWIAVQAAVEARLTGCTEAVVGVMVVGHQIDFYVIDIPLDTKIMPALLQAVGNFWKVIDSGSHPPIDWLKDGPAVLDVYRDTNGSKAEIADWAKFDALVEKYEYAKKQARDHEKDAAELRPKIIEMLGNADAGETLDWEVKAPTTQRKEYTVKATSFRALRCRHK